MTHRTQRKDPRGTDFRFRPGPALLAGAAILAAMPAAAQSPQPGGTVADQFERPDLPRSRQIAPFRIERPRPGQAPESISFTVRRIQIENAQAIDAAEIATLTGPLEGRTVTFAELAALADRITALYAQRGYALSFAMVPEQVVEDGVVRLRVVEGTVDAVQVEFATPPPLAGRRRVEAEILRRLRGLVRTGPVRTGQLERAVLGIDDLAGLDVSVVVRPSQNVEGSATLVIIVRAEPINVSLGVDNRLRSEFGREEGYAALAVNSSLLVGDRLELSSRRSLEDEAFRYASIGYDAPVGMFRFSAGYSRARTAAQRGLLGLLEYRGREEAFRAGLRYALIRARARSLHASVELSGIDTRTSLFGIRVVDENVRSVSAGITYDWADADGSRSLMAVTFVQGLEGLGATAADNPLRSRALGRPDARYVTARLYRDQELPRGWRLRLDNQVQMLVASRALPAVSECTFGGPAIGRAYDAGALSGDECWRGSAELARPIHAAGHAIEPYAFVDFGIARQHGPLEFGEQRRAEALSFGAGLRLFARFGLSADLQATIPGRRRFPGDDRDARFFFQLSFQR